ncbi:PLP-dependent aminotransferase family protein [Hyperthermus butylicus]|uniref:Transcriptional regulator n=1 Tax=Hyperthermus butylicus (strain DSM 5456 / JCM 9403 / PLM1-5) TaxID=415426 RepID=A2BJX0_HYPBU|nr:PLP-dependent aminotransferase family protein [Hyperthermus butylicus]ABM80281.1 transcriptional regulator [Hyperthermus butylicus DSM 5456]
MIDYDRFLSDYAKSVRASDIRELLKVVERGGVISFAGGLPDPNTFPKEEIAQIAMEVIIKHGEKALQYGPTRGSAYFLEAVREFSKMNGIPVRENEGIIATVGSQQSLYLVGKTLANPGDYIVTEEPTYLGAIQAFRSSGVRFLTVPIDEDGMRTDKLEEVLKEAVSEGIKIKYIYTIPTCHNPAGTTMPMERRKHLLELAEQYNILVIEDDPYSYITFEEREVKPLKAMDESGRVIYLSTLSKILAPGIRLGWAIGPEPIVAKMELVKQGMDLHTPTLTQYIAAEILKRGIIDRNIPKIKRIYKEKRDAMLRALEQYMPEGVKWTKPIGGLFIWVWLPEKINARKLLNKAIENGVVFVPGDSFFPNGGGKNTMRLNFSYPSPEEIEEGIKRLAKTIKEML